MTTHHDTMNAGPSDTTPCADAQKTKPKRANHRQIGVYVLILLFGFCSVYAMFKTNKLTERLILQKTQLNALKQQQMNGIKNLNTAQSELRSHVNTLERNLMTVLQQRAYQTKDWVYLKVRYTLELAQINAHWTDDNDTTQLLLRQADTLLANVSGAETLAIRQALAKEIVQVQSIPKLDMAGLLSQLDAASNLVDTIPLKAPFSTPKPNESTETASNWKTRLQDSVGLLEDLVVIRHHDEDVLPLPSKAQEAMLREEIRLNFLEAQWALLQRHGALYQSFLNQASLNITRTFAPGASETKALLKQVHSLQMAHLIQEKPALGTSLTLINQLIDAKNTSNDLKLSSAGVNPS